MTLPVALVEQAERAASAVFTAYLDCQREFRAVTRRAAGRFARREWRAGQADAAERLEVRARCVRQVVDELAALLGPRAADRPLWRQARAGFAARVAPMPDRELACTFFSSVTRKVLATEGIDPAVEFTAADWEVNPPPGALPLHRALPWPGSTAALLRAALAEAPLRAPWRDLEEDVALAAAALDAQLRATGGGGVPSALELLQPVLYRGQGAWLAGRLRRGAELLPLVLPVLHGPGGLRLDAALLGAVDASVVFSFTRNAFHVDVDRAFELVQFLRTLMPRKPASELYAAIGHDKHAKTELFREVQEHLLRSHERFEPARGQRGLVMAVFTLPSLDLVFKVIRDRFRPPKRTTPAEVRARYDLVRRHDRAGRMPEAQEFRRLAFARSRFTPAVLEELLGECAGTVRLEGERLLVGHLYAERRVEPLDLFLRERDEEEAARAVLDFGQALRDLAATNTFPGDLLLKNFGVTRTGRVIFYDYDELRLATDCAFRDLPDPAGAGEEEEGGEAPQFAVGDDDVFPGEILDRLGLPHGLRRLLVQAHGEALEAPFWRAMQTRHRAGEVVEVRPYREEQRLRPGRPS